MARASMERQVNGAMKGRSIFRDEKGSTTAGMAVALLVTLSLLFSAAQVYRIHAAGSEVQEVADAAACAALNPVAEFMVAVRVADAAVLSLTLLGDIAYGAGVVALCVPPAAELGSQLVSAGQKVLKARDALSQKACEGLGALQRALPFLAAANGAAVAAANGEGSGYAAMALLLPGEGSSIASGASAVEESMEEAVEAGKGELAEAASRAEEAARAAEEARARGFARDCGDNPSYCMYERAGRLAGLSGADNPLFASVDSWSFSVPLERARVYYRERLLSARPASDSAEEQARSALRGVFQPGYGYKEAGVILSQITPASAQQGSLFDPESRAKQSRLMKVLDTVNKSCGRGTLVVASQGTEPFRMNREHLSPRYTTDWKDLLVVKV